MKAIIPAAGQGTRLYPHTHTKPKAMVRLAGQPILGHILSNLADTRIDEVVIVVGGPMREQIVEYARDSYGDRFEFEFVEQPEPEGLGHSVYQATPVVGDEPVMIALGDMLFESGYRAFLNSYDDLAGPDGAIGIKQVDQPQHYGVVEVDTEDGRIVDMVEKPDDPPSDLAISGIYIIEDTPALFDVLGEMITNDVRGAGDEFQLTDALKRLVLDGDKLYTFDVEEWYDCGRPETLLEANRVLLSRLDTDAPDDLDGSVVVPPVDFGDDIEVTGSVIGPHVSVDDGTTITDSIVSDSILGEEATVEGVNISESILGDNAAVRGEPNHLNLGDNSSIEL
jgi:glucose-1-phosphate thymidylyltransferase